MHAFEARSADYWGVDQFEWGSDDEAAEEDVSGDAAGETLVEFLLSLHYAGKLSARTLCVICWFAAKSGAQGPVEKFGFRPEAPTGHFQRHLDSCTGANPKQQQRWRYSIAIPGHSKYDVSRTAQDIYVNVPHEVLNEEILEDPSILQKTRETQWPPAYYANPIVQGRGAGVVVPFALYVDAVPTTKRDSVLGFWMYNLVSLKRHLIVVLRKSALCRCGCRGWDSIHPVWAFIRWSIESMARGIYPDERHDHLPWKLADAERKSLAGSELSFVGMLLQIKGDWMEFCSSLGFASWMTDASPCMFCHCTSASLRNFTGFSPLSTPSPLVTPEEYKVACERCEVHLVLDRPQWSLVRNSLHYFKPSQGPRGRALTRNLPELGLRKHDRLEPDLLWLDVASFDNPTSWPVRATFWRRSAETRVRRRCVLFDDGLGISLDTVCIDLLHCLWLGPAKDWCCSVFWALIDSNVFGFAGGVEERHMMSTQHIKNELWAFYSRWATERPGDDLTALQEWRYFTQFLSGDISPSGSVRA